ncbi:MAG: DUF2236 domain-containing protein [Mycobacteriaceae bacterium]|nr:DUF2236 domain-containing protein [Mycobacteriaceae bacterium]
MPDREQVIPSRHPRTPRRRLPGIRPFARLMGIGSPSPTQWRELGEGLTVGDPPMDELVAWMHHEGMARTRPLFDRALQRGIATVPDAPAPLRRFFGAVETPPEWVDQDRVRRGAQVFRAGGADGLYIARDVSFLGGYLASGFNQTLIRTGAMEKGPARRFAETLQWALDVTADGGMDRLGPGYRSTIHVRLIHALVRRHVAALPDWQSDRWGLPINQTDMAATLVGALIAPFVGGIVFGIVPTRTACDDAAHLTRYVGWLMGVDEPRLPTTFRDGIRILHHSLAAITNPDETTPQLALPMADDPRHWHYPALPALRGSIARSQHLSIATLFLGPAAMKRLGLPAWTPPWYPALRLPVNALHSLAIRVRPGGPERAAGRGRRQQEAFLRTLVGSDPAVIGAAAS